MTTEREEITAIWTYAGRRQLAGGGLANVYYDDQGEEHRFEKLPVSVVGGRYEVKCTPDRKQVIGAPRWDRKGERDERAAVWQLKDRVAYVAEQAAKLERQAAREEPMGELTLNEVRLRLSGASRAQRTAMLALVLRHLGA